MSAVVLACLVALVACLPFPLGDPEKSQLDPKLVGYWKYEKGDEGYLIALYPFDQRAYALEYVDYKKFDGLPVRKSQVLFKAWLTDVKARTFITLEPLEQRMPGAKDDKKTYPVLKISSAADNGLETRRVNEEFDGFKDVKSSDDVRAVITREVDNPKLYVDDPWIFRRLEADAGREMLEKLRKGTN
jgi:hypothetical protein